MQKKGGVAAVDRIRYLRIEFEQETKSKKKPMQCEAKLPPKVCIHSSKISFVADEKLIHIYNKGPESEICVEGRKREQEGAKFNRQRELL